MKSLEIKKINKRVLDSLPNGSGVYIFWDNQKKPIYVGKSVRIKLRVKSYFLKDLSPKTSQMISKAKYISTIMVDSDLEALLLEAKLIKKLQPKYNIQLKDDKHPLYIKITKDEFPQVLTARKIDQEKDYLAFFGPFPSSQNVRNVLRLLRKIFPYAQHKVGKRACFYSQMGLCDPCPSEIVKVDKDKAELLKKKYLKNIKNIKKTLEGKIKFVKESLQQEMISLSNKERFEDARVLRDQIQMLEYITQSVRPVSDFLKNPNLYEEIRSEETKALHRILSQFMKIPEKLNRIECYDVSHLGGTSPAASMVTFIKGEPEKTYYRHFRINEEKGGDDLLSLKEVINRRLKHLNDWGKPDLIMVDGGKTQVAVFWGVLKSYSIPVVGLAKRFETLVIPYAVRGKLAYKEIVLSKGVVLNLLQRIRDEAHRFAQRYHHKLIEKSLFSN